jgi:nucleoside-diphosphate-sugar epimerase
MTTLVTGAFGYIGAWVVRALLAEGERPAVYDLGDDPRRLRMIVGPAPRTGLAEGVRRTLETFSRLAKDDRLDARELA